MIRRPLRALRELDRRLDEMHAADRVAEEWARFELARSASRFSRRATEVVDSTMSLSATLMRAGEVDEANRLMKEAENEVRTEKAALIETVNEVKVAEQVRKKRLTRLKLAKLMATTLLSSGMFVVSAFGMVMARQFVGDDPAMRRPNLNRAQGAATAIPRQLHRIEVVPGVSLSLTGSELRQYIKMTRHGDTIELIAFLEGRLPSNIVDRVQATLIAAVNDVEIPDVGGSAKLLAQAQETAEASPEASAEPSASASPDEGQATEAADGGEASPEPSPNSSPDGEETEKGGDGEGEGTELGGIEIPPVEPGR